MLKLFEENVLFCLVVVFAFSLLILSFYLKSYHNAYVFFLVNGFVSFVEIALLLFIFSFFVWLTF